MINQDMALVQPDWCVVSGKWMKSERAPWRSLFSEEPCWQPRLARMLQMVLFALVVLSASLDLMTEVSEQ